MTIRTAVYARYSTDLQSEASIADQLRVCRERAAREDWPIVGEYTDEGISGTALGNRPGMQRLICDALAGAFDLILVLELLRLARGEDLPPLIRRFTFRGVRVISIQDGFDSTVRTARMQAGMAAIMGGEFIEMISRRVHSALEMRAKERRPTGGRAYGFDNAGRPVEPEASIAVEIFRRYAAGEGMHWIASDLNARGVASPGSTWNRKTRRQDGRWLISTLHAMLMNDRYTGRVVWNRSIWVKDPDSGKRVRRERPQSEWIINEGPALIDEATWSKVRSRISERTRVYGQGRGGQPRYLLSGLLVCELCNGRMIIAGNGGSHYYCGTHRHGGSSACSMSIGVRRDVAEEVILRPIRDELLSPAAVSRAVSMIRHWHRQERARIVQEPSPELAKVEAAIADIETLIAQDAARAEILGGALEAQRQRRTALQRQAWRQATARRTINDDIPAERAYRSCVERMSEVLDGKNIAAARDVLRKVLEEVPVRPDETGSHLIATVRISAAPFLEAVPLLKQAVGVDWVGSGGRI